MFTINHNTSSSSQGFMSRCVLIGFENIIFYKL